MGKIEIVDDCPAPERHIWLRYSGTDPWGVVEKVTDLIRPFFHVSASGTGHVRLNWDVTGDPISFFSVWWVKRKLSRFSFIKVDIRVLGTKGKTTNTGEFAMRIKGNVETEFSGWSVILKPVWYMYSYLFYNALRRKYIENCRELLQKFRDEIKEHYNLKTTEMPAGVSMG